MSAGTIIGTPDLYEGLLKQIQQGKVVLFLGSGSSRLCCRADGKTGLTGEELADEILYELAGKHPGFKASLMQAAEYYTWSHPDSCGGLDEFLRLRLEGLRPTLGHYLAASLPWKAVVTTNYNQVVEDAWHEAHANGYSPKPILLIRSDEELKTYGKAQDQLRIYKPHGCLKQQDLEENPIVITSQDYYRSMTVRRQMYAELTKLASQCTTLFVGYSLNDYTFRNLFYQIRASRQEWTKRSYSVTPIRHPLEHRWMSRTLDKAFQTTLVSDNFDTFMLRLLAEQGYMAKPLKKLLAEHWAGLIAGNGAYSDGLVLDDFLALPEK